MVKVFRNVSLSFFLLSVTTYFAYGQYAFVAAGGNKIEERGTFSYSIGQVVYTTAYSSSYSLAQGVQQPFEFSNPFSVEEFFNLPSFEVYPIPTSNSITLWYPDKNTSPAYFDIIDVSGRKVLSGWVEEEFTAIDLTTFAAGPYIFCLSQGNRFKSLRIIKN